MVDWVAAWQRQTAGELDAEQLAFLEDVDRMVAGSPALWGPPNHGRRFDRLALEGPANNPRMVCYFHDETRRPGLPMAFEWPLEWRDGLDTGTWIGNFLEELDEGGVYRLPTEPGPDGVARITDV